MMKRMRVEHCQAISAGVNLFWLCKQMGHKGPDMLFRNHGSSLSGYDGQLTRPGVKTGSE
ncbi:hypothetical protein AC790_12705 [Pantoea sp. RIT-PI-b]|nr:hypothetical protein AC790_12705 [Pantoea sp. RIT-PI-b]